MFIFLLWGCTSLLSEMVNQELPVEDFKIKFRCEIGCGTSFNKSKHPAYFKFFFLSFQAYICYGERAKWNYFDVLDWLPLEVMASRSSELNSSENSACYDITNKDVYSCYFKEQRILRALRV